MKNINKILFILIAAVSVGLMGYAIYVGMSAPESSKIASNMALVQKFDENGEVVNNEKGEPVPVQTTAEGIEALKTVFATQYKNGDDGILYGESLEEAKAKLEQTKNTTIPELEAKIEAERAAYEAAKEVVANKRASKKQLEEANKTVEAFVKMEADLKTHKDNVVAWTENIPASEAAIAQAEVDGQAVEALAKAVSYNIMWVYFLMVFAVAFMVLNAIMNMFQNPASMIKTAVSVVVVLAVIGIAYFIAQSHGWNEGAFIKDAAGLPLGIGAEPNRVVFGAFEYMISDVCILVTYIAFVGAALATLYTAIRGSFKS